QGGRLGNEMRDETEGEQDTESGADPVAGRRDDALEEGVQPHAKRGGSGGAVVAEGVEAFVDGDENQQPPEGPGHGGGPDAPDRERQDLEGSGPGKDAGCQGDNPKTPG